jgi:hypothetical protein
MDTLRAGRPPRSARAMTRRPPAAAAAVALAAVALALSACATPAAPPATTDATAPPTTTAATPEPAPGSVQPASRYDLTCDELVPPSNISDMFTVALAPADPLATAAAAGISVPRMSSILSIGGLACGWSNGAEYNSQFGTNPAYTGVLVTVVPPQASGWSPAATDAGMPMPGTSCDATMCDMTRVASAAWIVLEAYGGPDAILPAGAEGVANAAVAAVDSASPPGPAPVVASALPDDCEQMASASAVEGITGRTGLAAGPQGGGWSEWSESRWIAGDLGCHWMPTDADESVVAAFWVRGGVWAFDRIESAGALVPAPTAITIAGADRAVVRCDPSRRAGSCGVDLLIGPDWVQVTAEEQDWAVGVAEEIAANTTG